jgi:predicted GNAT family N-acyltransferase
MRLRHAVFCGEQGIPEALEYDELDATAVHLAVIGPDGELAGTCRLLAGPRTWRLGRMAVAPEARGRGAARALLAAAHRQAAAAGAEEMRLSAQVAVRGLYAGAGYRPVGPEYEEAGIPHVAMVRALGAEDAG